MNRRSPHRVSDVMTRTVVAVGLDARFKEIVTAIDQWQVTAVPVLEGRGASSGWSPRRTCCPRRSCARRTRP